MNTIFMIMYKRYSCENDFEPIIVKLGYRGKFQYQQFVIKIIDNGINRRGIRSLRGFPTV